MKRTYIFPLTFMGGAVGWEAVKALVFPMIVWSGTIVGTTAYVHWVIKSHNANVLRLQAGAVVPAMTDTQVTQFSDELSETVTSRENFIETYSAGTVVLSHMPEEIASLRDEDAKVLAEVDQLQTQSSGAYTSDMAAKADKLRSLDDQLKSMGVQVSHRD